jgi:hypothetical protein
MPEITLRLLAAVPPHSLLGQGVDVTEAALEGA